MASCEIPFEKRYKGERSVFRGSSRSDEERERERMQIVCEYKLKFYDYLSHVSALLLPPDRCDVCMR